MMWIIFDTQNAACVQISSARNMTVGAFSYPSIASDGIVAFHTDSCPFRHKGNFEVVHTTRVT